MSQAIAQSATQLTVSNNGEWTEDMFLGAVRRAAERKLGKSGITTERLMLKTAALNSAVAADYRMHFAAMYGKSERLPSEVFEQIQSATEKYIAMQLTKINSTNVLNKREYFFHNSKELEITHRITITGENKVSLEQQRFACHLMINEQNRKLTDLQAKKTPDYDREKAVKATLMKLAMTEQFINGEIAHQQKVAEEAAAQ